jgi:hypothetical protein
MGAHSQRKRVEPRRLPPALSTTLSSPLILTPPRSSPGQTRGLLHPHTRVEMSVGPGSSPGKIEVG